MQNKKKATKRKTKERKDYKWKQRTVDDDCDQVTEKQRKKDYFQFFLPIDF